MKTQICLVSQQAAANLLPALDTELKPERIILVVTRKMQVRAEHLTYVLKQNHIDVEQFELTDEGNFHGTTNELLDLASNQDKGVILNITGGTKLMSIAAQRVAEQAEWPMFYVNADTDEITWLNTDAQAPQPLRQQLKLRHYLRSYGYELPQKPQRKQATPEQQRLTTTLVQEVGRLHKAISILNAITQNAEDHRSLSAALTERQLDSLSLDVLIRHFQDARALRFDGTKISFANEEARDFVKGGWLELHAIQCVHQMTGPLKIRDKAVGLEVVDVNNGTKNELDVAFMARNRMFVLECKTGRIDKGSRQAEGLAAPKANDALFKLAGNCRRMGGIGTRGMLVSYRPLNKPEYELANSLNIKVVAGSRIAQLPQELDAWVNG